MLTEFNCIYQNETLTVWGSRMNKKNFTMINTCNKDFALDKFDKKKKTYWVNRYQNIGSMKKQF